VPDFGDYNNPPSMPAPLFAPERCDPPSLDPHESTEVEPRASASPPEYDPWHDTQRSFRHSGWAHTRQKVLDALHRSETSLARRARFKSCGHSWWVLRSTDHPGRYKRALDTCRDRFCEPCGRDRASILRRNLATHLPATPLRFITLTLRSSDDGLSRQLDRLYGSYKLLRAKRIWRDRVTAAAAFLELTLPEQTYRWHVHLHVLAAGEFLPQGDLSAAWLDVTGDSKIVDIRLVKHRKTAISYVTKYVTKPLPHSVTAHPYHLAEAVIALQHRKLINVTGAWKRWRLLRDPDDDSWALIGSWEEIEYRALNGDAWAEELLTAAASADPATGEFTAPVEPEPPP
jgi:hypothetical protein